MLFTRSFCFILTNLELTCGFCKSRMKIYSANAEQKEMRKEAVIMKRLPDSELEIMMIIWEWNKPVTRFEIEEKLDKERKLSPTTILSFLSRLQEKGFLEVQKAGKNNVYIALIDKDSYMQTESKNVLKRLYNNSAKNFLAALYDGDNLSEEDLSELAAYLEEKRKG